MGLAFEARQDIRRMVALVGVSLAFLVVQTTPALTAAYPDRDGLRSSTKRNVAETNPFKVNSDRDGIKDKDRDGEVDEDD